MSGRERYHKNILCHILRHTVIGQPKRKTKEFENLLRVRKEKHSNPEREGEAPPNRTNVRVLLLATSYYYSRTRFSPPRPPPRERTLNPNRRFMTPDFCFGRKFRSTRDTFEEFVIGFGGGHRESGLLEV